MMVNKHLPPQRAVHVLKGGGHAFTPLLKGAIV
jgi:hypothetical protein